MLRRSLLSVSLFVATACSGTDDATCQALRRGVEMCDPSGASGFTCAGLPSSYRACVDRIPARRSDEACTAFMGCLYDGP